MPSPEYSADKGGTPQSIQPYMDIVTHAGLLEDFGFVARFARGHGRASLLETRAELQQNSLQHPGIHVKLDAVEALIGQAYTNGEFLDWLAEACRNAYDTMARGIWAEDVARLGGTPSIPHQYSARKDV